ncbi:MAG: precorrin-3B synthase [Pseudorhodobacter sp.]|nr:precorrin-3B synthase [Pseudorhodobacter sp.]
MTTPIIKGWCPGARRPMQSGDGLVVRVRPQAGRLTADQAAGIAALSRAHGSGVIDLSARANLQLRGVTLASHPALIAGLGALGLIDASPEIEARRNIVVTPFWTAGDGTEALAQTLAEALAADDAPALPGKFGFALDTGAALVLRAVSADIWLERHPGGGLMVRADGAATGAVVDWRDGTDAALDLARWFVASGGISEGRGRMAAHLARGAVLPQAFRATRSAEAEPFTPAPGLYPVGALVAIAFGQTTAQTLAALATLGPLRLTPWRMLLIEGLAGAPALPGLITDPGDPLLRVVACPGAPACPQALQPTRALARALAAQVPQGDLLHVSGCAKGCAHPGAAPFTLVAQETGYALIRGGTAATPAASALSAAALQTGAPTLFEAP